MPRTIIFTAAVISVVFAVACAGDGDSDRAPAASPTAVVGGLGTPAATPTIDGAGGTPDVIERAVAAVTAGDAQALAALVTFARTPCETTPQGAGGPAACGDGETPGTLVDAVLATQCEGMYIRPGQLLDRLSHLEFERSQLYGAYRKDDVFSLPSRYIAIFERPRDVAPHGVAWALVFDDDGIIGIDFGCGQPAADMAQARDVTDRIAP